MKKRSDATTELRYLEPSYDYCQIQAYWYRECTRVLLVLVREGTARILSKDDRADRVGNTVTVWKQSEVEQVHTQHADVSDVNCNPNNFYSIYFLNNNITKIINSSLKIVVIWCFRPKNLSCKLVV